MSLDGIRDVLKLSLGLSLGALSHEDRLVAAWTLVCGKTMAEHGADMGYADGIVRVQVKDRVWLRQLMSMRGQLAEAMARVADVEVTEIQFEMKRQ